MPSRCSCRRHVVAAAVTAAEEWRSRNAILPPRRRQLQRALGKRPSSSADSTIAPACFTIRPDVAPALYHVRRFGRLWQIHPGAAISGTARVVRRADPRDARTRRHTHRRNDQGFAAICAARQRHDAETELLLFEASRSQLVRETIQPALQRGVCVISDRFFDSTTVYQGVARKLDAQLVQQLNHFAVGDCVPDLTFVLDVDVDTARARMLRRVRPVSRDRMEEEPIDFYQAVRDAYRELAKRIEPRRFD